MESVGQASTVGVGAYGGGPMSTPAFGAREVLEAAAAILKQRQVGPSLYPCDKGPWCPWCACGEAKAELDERHGVDQPGAFSDAFRMLMTGSLEPAVLPGDEPAIAARQAMNPWADIEASELNQARAIEILESARDTFAGGQ